MRITDHYFWNFIFGLFFLYMVVWGSIILETVSYKPLGDMTPFEFVILSFATLRLTRLVVYDTITAFFREQFFDVKKTKTGIKLEKPASGPRRTLADLLTCPWCFGVWAGATVVFFYYLTSYAWFPILFLAISGAASLLQLLANMIGWKAEQLKEDIDSL